MVRHEADGQTINMSSGEKVILENDRFMLKRLVDVGLGKNIEWQIGSIKKSGWSRLLNQYNQFGI